MAPHAHHLPGENVLAMRRMKRVDLGVHSARQIVVVVALDGLVEERQADQKHREDDDPKAVTAARFCGQLQIS